MAAGRGWVSVHTSWVRVEQALPMVPPGFYLSYPSVNPCPSPKSCDTELEQREELEQRCSGFVVLSKVLSKELKEGGGSRTHAGC